VNIVGAKVLPRKFRTGNWVILIRDRVFTGFVRGYKLDGYPMVEINTAPRIHTDSIGKTISAYPDDCWEKI
jgi:hypothetical protein